MFCIANRILILPCRYRKLSNSTNKCFKNYVGVRYLFCNKQIKNIAKINIYLQSQFSNNNKWRITIDTTVHSTKILYKILKCFITCDENMFLFFLNREERYTDSALPICPNILFCTVCCVQCILELGDIKNLDSILDRKKDRFNRLVLSYQKVIKIKLNLFDQLIFIF